jgi:hypothetical protein
MKKNMPYENLFTDDSSDTNSSRHLTIGQIIDDNKSGIPT